MFSLLDIYNSDIGVNAVIVRLILRLIDVFQLAIIAHEIIGLSLLMAEW